jgi:murein DD-endopeptidase MepM/ murein hydrolase activator NlpD
MHTKNQISLTRKTLYGIMLLAIFLVAFGVENSSSATVKAQASTDFGFLNTIGLPWKCGEADPRMVTKDWNDHWNNNTAKGAAIDFNFEGNGDDNKDVLAPFSGTITKSEWIDDAYGEGIIIDAGNGWSVLIAHLKTGTLLSKGTAINKGQLIAKSDNSGISSGPHIHLEFLWNGERPDAGWFNTGGNFLFIQLRISFHLLD